MSTIPRRPAAQEERGRLQTRRLRATELFAAGVRQAEVARQLEVSAQAVSVWHARWTEGGTAALYSRGPSGPAPRASRRHDAYWDLVAALTTLPDMAAWLPVAYDHGRVDLDTSTLNRRRDAFLHAALG